MSQNLNMMNMSLDTIARLQHLYREINNTIQMAQHVSSQMVPLTGDYNKSRNPPNSHRLNPEAPEFVSSRSVPAKTTHRWEPRDSKPDDVLFKDLLQEGETVYLSIVTGRHEDNYPKFSAAVCTYENNRFNVYACDEVPSMIGQSSEKPGVLLYKFIDGLYAAKKLNHRIKVTVWKHCGVKRDGKHISLYNLAALYRNLH